MRTYFVLAISPFNNYASCRRSEFKFLFSIDFFANLNSDCDCVTCLFAGGPCTNQAKEVLEKYYCTKCSFYEKLDRDYMDYIKKDITRRLEDTSDKSLPNTDDDDNDIDLDDELTDAVLENHCYHLSWAVFKHLPCKCNKIVLGIDYVFISLSIFVLLLLLLSM